MPFLAFVAGLILIFAVLVDAFETVVLPRRVSSRYRIAGVVNRSFWWLWSQPVRQAPSRRWRENYLAVFGPLLLLVMLILWVIFLILGYALIYWALQSPFLTQAKGPIFELDLYASGSTLFTGLGDISPVTWIARVLMVSEVGMGFAFLALVIGYVPPVYQAFADREAKITLLDARAGSPPTAFELLRRCGESDRCVEARDFFENNEILCAEILETHLSYPVLSFYRSQHENQSWLAAITMILDTAALVVIGVEGMSKQEGRLTFAMARHTIVDLAQVHQVPPHNPSAGRLSREDFEKMRAMLKEVGMNLEEDADSYERLAKIRLLYEPYLEALSDYLLMPIPGWMPENEILDNWKLTAWGGPGQIRL